jgi:hypothetical protein
MTVFVDVFLCGFMIKIINTCKYDMTCRVVYSILKGSGGGRWRWVVNFNPRPPYPWERASVPTDIRLGGPQTQSGLFWRGICLSSTWTRRQWACSTVPIPGLANLWHAERFRWYATFNAVPNFLFSPDHCLYIVTDMCANTVGTRSATVRFKTIHFYDPCRVGPSTTDLWCITVTTQASLSLHCALLALFRCACVSSFSILVQFF